MSVPLTRRQFLTATGGAVAAAGPARGQTADPTSTPTTSAPGPESAVPFETSRVVNAASDLGWDREGAEPIDDSLESVLDEGDITVRIPPGEYLVAEELQHVSGTRNVAFVGTGDSRRDVRVTVPEGDSRRLWTIRNARNFYLGNLSMDQQQDWATSTGMVITGPDGITLQRVDLIGRRGRDGTKALSVRATDPDGVALVEDFRRLGGQIFEDYDTTGDELCIHLGGDHRGTIYFRNLHIEHAGSSALYASRCPGEVRVQGGLFVNNQNTALRVSGAGNYIDGATIIFDTSLPRFQERNQAGPNLDVAIDQLRGIWWESGFRGQSGGHIRNTDIIARNGPRSAGLIVINGSAGGVTIDGCRLENHIDDAPPIRAEPPGSGDMIGGSPGGGGPHPHAVEIRNTSITDDADGNRPAIHIQERDGSRVVNCCLDVAQRSGVALINCADAVVADCAISAGGGPAVQTLPSPGAVVRGITNNPSCALPTAAPQIAGSTGEEKEAMSAGALVALGGIGVVGVVIAGVFITLFAGIGAAMAAIFGD